VRDGSALVAGDVGDPGFEEGLGDREDALAMEFVAIAQPELLDFPLEGAFRHTVPYFIPKWGRDGVRRNSGLGTRKRAFGVL